MTLYFADDNITLHHGDALDVLRQLPGGVADCIVTSPPYFGLRDYGVDGQIGLESNVQEYADALVPILAELHRVLNPHGTLWLNVADCYGGGGIARPTGKWPTAHNPADRTNGRRRSFDMEKCLLGVPDAIHRALVDCGWVVRNRIIWAKDRPMPSSATDRLNSQYETVFLAVKRDGRRPNYHFVKNDGRGVGDVWEIPQGSGNGHPAPFPVELAARCIHHGCIPGGTVLDPFSGSGSTGAAAVIQGCKYIGVDLNADYLKLSLNTRLREQPLDFGVST